MGRTACIHVCRKHEKQSLRDVGVDSVAHLNLFTNVCHCLMKQNENLTTNKDGSIVVKHNMSVEKTGSLYSVTHRNQEHSSIQCMENHISPFQNLFTSISGLIHVGAMLGRQLKSKDLKIKEKIAKKGNRSNAAIEHFVLQASR